MGQINGYFNNKVTEKFFRLMAVYIATNTIGSISWAIPFGKEEVDYMIKNAEEVYELYKGFKTFIPDWYKEKVEY